MPNLTQKIFDKHLDRAVHILADFTNYYERTEVMKCIELLGRDLKRYVREFVRVMRERGYDITKNCNNIYDNDKVWDEFCSITNSKTDDPIKKPTVYKFFTDLGLYFSSDQRAFAIYIAAFLGSEKFGCKNKIFYLAIMTILSTLICASISKDPECKDIVCGYGSISGMVSESKLVNDLINKMISLMNDNTGYKITKEKYDKEPIHIYGKNGKLKNFTQTRKKQIQKPQEEEKIINNTNVIQKMDNLSIKKQTISSPRKNTADSDDVVPLDSLLYPNSPANKSATHYDRNGEKFMSCVVSSEEYNDMNHYIQYGLTRKPKDL